MNKYFIGWDVGAWHCDKNRNSRDAWYVLSDNKEFIAPKPFWGNCRKQILESNSALKFLNTLFEKSELEFKGDDEVIIAIDTPLGFPSALLKLLNGQTLGPDSLSLGFSKNPYLFRKTEMSLPKQKRPLSAVQDSIGAQATKGIHFINKFGFKAQEVGIWKVDNVTVIETYPATLNLYRTEVPLDLKLICQEFSTSKEIQHSSYKDVQDAFLCARLAKEFHYNINALISPNESIPKSEGWIWTLNKVSTNEKF